MTVATRMRADRRTMLIRAMQTLDVARRVGFRNSAAVALYRARCRSGWIERRLPVGEAYGGLLFNS